MSKDRQYKVVAPSGSVLFQSARKEETVAFCKGYALSYGHRAHYLIDAEGVVDVSGNVIAVIKEYNHLLPLLIDDGCNMELSFIPSEQAATFMICEEYEHGGTELEIEISRSQVEELMLRLQQWLQDTEEK